MINTHYVTAVHSRMKVFTFTHGSSKLEVPASNLESARSKLADSVRNAYKWHLKRDIKK